MLRIMEHLNDWPGAHAAALILQQTSSLNSNDFSIKDGEGNDVARVESRGTPLGRFMMGTRSLDITDCEGNVLLHVKDNVSLGRDRFTLSDAKGNDVVKIVRRMAVFRTKVKAEIIGGPTLELKGDLWGWDFRITADGKDVATVGRKWAGIARGLLGRSRYAVAFGEGVSPERRLQVLGVVVVLDLIRHKDAAHNATATSSS